MYIINVGHSSTLPTSSHHNHPFLLQRKASLHLLLVCLPKLRSICNKQMIISVSEVSVVTCVDVSAQDRDRVVELVNSSKRLQAQQLLKSLGDSPVSIVAYLPHGIDIGSVYTVNCNEPAVQKWNGEISFICSGPYCCCIEVRF